MRLTFWTKVGLAMLAVAAFAIAYLGAKAPAKAASCGKADSSAEHGLLLQAAKAYTKILATEPDSTCAADGMRSLCERAWDLRRTQHRVTEPNAVYKAMLNQEPVTNDKRSPCAELGVKHTTPPPGGSTTYVAGPPGPAGKDGKDGTNGTDGADGPPGADGKDGTDGQVGRAGAAGKDGKDGADGRAGAAGKNGKDGATGRAGADGRDGAPGRAGTAGRDGKNGTDGAAGKDGKDGKDGADGSAGADGKDGRNGKDGRDGRDGKPGPPGPPSKTVVICKRPDACRFAG